MRFSIFTVAIISAFIQISIASESTAQVNLKMKTDVIMSDKSLIEILKELSNKTHIPIVYSRLPSLESIVTIKAVNRSVKEILDELVLDRLLSYTVIGDKIVIKSLLPLQKIDCIVLNEFGIPLQGVSVSVRGRNAAGMTNAEGKIDLQLRIDDVIIFSFMGYEDVIYTVKSLDHIRISMKQIMQEVDEVVINTGYQSIDRKKFTGSAVTIKAADAQRAGIPDVSRMLEGQAAGVSVQNVSGTFGAAPKIRVRGSTSITGDNKPLWVIDGVILEDVVNISNDQLSSGDANTLLGSSVAGLNPDDIESIQILKDVSATSLYGARAMNGVVIINTKRGKAGSPAQISYTGNYTSYLKPSYSQFDIISSYDQMSIFAEMERKGWLDYTDLANSSNGGIYTKLAQALQYRPDGSVAVENSVEGRRKFLEQYINANTDWFDVLFKNSLMQDHSISLTSGSEKNQNYFSTSFMKDNGWTISDKAKRFTLNARSEFQISPRLSIGLISSASIREQSAPGSLSRNSDPVTGAVSRNFDINPFSYAMNTTRTIRPYDENGNLEYVTMRYSPFNILNELDNNVIELRMLDLKLQGELKYKLPKDIQYSFTGSYRYVSTGNEHKIREQSNMPMAYRAGTAYSTTGENTTIADRNKYLYVDPTDPDARPATILPYGGFYLTNDDFMKSYYFRNALDWTKTMYNKHLLRVYVAQELRYMDRTGKSFTGYGYQYDRGGVAFIDPKAIVREVEGNQSYYAMGSNFDRYVALASNIAYSYNNRFQINSTVRYDGSNQMGESTTARWLPTWNVSGSWNVDEEAFMKDQSLISLMTVRASYGLNASMGAARNSSLILGSSSTYRPYLKDIEPVLNIISNPNKDLTWEKQYETNIGFDMHFANKRLEMALDVYQRDGFDLIGIIRNSGIGGEPYKLANYADMKSKGIELMLRTTILNSEKWGWKLQLTNAYNTGKITRLLNEPQIFDLISNVGGAKQNFPVRGLFSIPFDKLDPYTGVPSFIDEQGNSNSSVFLQSDNTNYLKYEGNIDPTFNGGLHNNVNFKNFSLAVLVTYSAGNKIRLNPIFQNTYSDMQAMSYDFLKRYILPYDGAVPSIVESRNASSLEGSAYQAYNYSTARVTDGAFARLKQITIGYQVPTNVLNKTRLKSLQINLVANNVMLLSANKRLNGQDPEFYGSGGVALPLPRQFSFSLKTTL